MKTNERKKGISLIVLIITILVMIILAAAIILNIDDTKIINNADKAVAKNNMAVAKEVRVAAKAEWRVNESKLKAEGYSSFGAYLEYKLEEAGLEGIVESSSDGNELYAVPVIPDGFVASDATGENKVRTGLVIYETTTPVTNSNVDTARTTYSQYVWVPVNDIESFTLKQWDENAYHQSYNLTDAIETKEYEVMKKSVEKYGGFFIGRYEAGNDGNGNVVNLKNITPWVEVTWEDTKAACDSSSTDTYIVHLIYGEQWDAALSFIAKTYSTYPLSSTNGNYTGTLVNTGSNDAWAVNNIYDMAGNRREKTMENVAPDGGTEKRISRGGTAASVTFAAKREVFSVTHANGYHGFRAALYLK